METQNEVMIIIAAQDKFSVEMKRIETEARDTKKKLDKELVYKLKADVAAFDLALKEVRSKLRKAKTAEEKWKLTLDTQDLQRQLTEAKRKLNNYLNTGDQNTSRLQAKFNNLGDTIKDVFSGSGLGALDGFLGKIPKIGGKLQAILAIIIGIGKALVQAGKNAQEFEDAFAGVRKTVDDSEYNLRKIEGGLVEMSKHIPLTVKELGAIAEMGGQLGVPTENLLSFTDAIAKLSVSTNLTAEAAATDFARIANITQEPLINIDRMGATVVALGNNFATTEREIVNFSTNIAGAGEISGLTTEQIFAIGAAFSSVGIEAEAGGTATQKVLLSINNAVNKGGEQLHAYARVAGKSADEFKRAWKDNAGEGFLSFVQGLQSSGQDANLILEEMGLKDVRLQKSFLSLANAGDLLANTLNLANQAREENNALQEEADKRFQTTTSQIQIQNNKWQAFSAQFGMIWNAIRVPIFGGFTDFFTSTLPTAGNNIGIFFENTIQLIYNFGRNIRKGVSNLPAAFTSATNTTLSVLENFVNKGISGLNSFINLIKKVPGVAELIGDFNIGTISLGKVSGPEFEGVSLTDGFKEFESFSKNRSKQYEIAAGKVKEGIKKEIQTEVDMLSDIQNILDNKKGGSSKSKTDKLKKALEKERDMEMKAIQDSLLDEEEKMRKLNEIKEKYEKKKKDIEGKTNDELLKEAEEYMKKLKKGREDNYKDHQKKADDAIKDVKKYTENLDKIKEKFGEIKEKAQESLRSIKNELGELENDHIKALGDRYYELKKKLADGGYDTEELRAINEELDYLDGQLTDDQKEKSKKEAEKSESQRMVEKYQQAKKLLEEKKKITEALNATEKVDGEKKLRVEGESVEYRDAEKEKFVEITDFKNAEYARDLLNQQTKLETEYNIEKKHLEDSRKLVLNHSKEILNIWENDTELYKKQLNERGDAVRSYVDNVKAMMAEINEAKAKAQSASITNNNQVTNSNNRTTNYNITNVSSGSSRFSGVAGLK